MGEEVAEPNLGMHVSGLSRAQAQQLGQLEDLFDLNICCNLFDDFQGEEAQAPLAPVLHHTFSGRRTGALMSKQGTRVSTRAEAWHTLWLH
jgi:hypothetical protein